jgi:hypothetical protein
MNVPARSYKLLRADDARILANEVNEFLAAGWELYGPTVLWGFDNQPRYHQAMVKL